MYSSNGGEVVSGLSDSEEGNIGEVTERSKVHDWKSCGGSKAFPRVRIPPSPP